jgi:predicted nucleic acid-binding protein
MNASGPCVVRSHPRKMFHDAGRSRAASRLRWIKPGHMILVDTSIWIRFLSNHSPYADCLDALLDRREVAGHELIYGELLIGDRGGRTKLLAGYEKMHQAPVVAHGEVVALVRGRNLYGRGRRMDRPSSAGLGNRRTPAVVDG